MNTSRPLSCALFAALLAAAAPAHSDEPDAATRAANTVSAVKLAEEAGELFKAGSFAKALERYQRADALVVRHTIRLRIARCLASLGRLNEAAERYSAVSRMPLPTDLDPDKLAKQQEALAQADAERAALLPRIPAIIVQIAGAPDAVVTLDGQRFPAALLGEKRETDPGPHHLEARAGAAVVTRDFVLAEHQVLDLPIALRPTLLPPVPPPIPPHDATPPPPISAGDAGDADDHRALRRTLGFAGIGVGAAGIALGAITGAIAVGKRSELQSANACGPALMCPHAYASEASTYDTLRNASSAGFVAGGIVAAAGIVLVTTAPSDAPKPATRYAIFAWPGGAELRRTF